MKICFLVDARSPIAINWVKFFVERDHDVNVISSYPCNADAVKGARVYEVPVALSRFSRTSPNGADSTERGLAPRALASLGSRFQSAASLAVQRWVLPHEVGRRVSKVKQLITSIRPDLVHAMRVPFEAVLAARALPPALPLVVSVWGNDFTLWAERNPLIAQQTRQTLRRADALHVDCKRDLRMAIRSWGFDESKPSTVLPGAGGVQSSIFHQGEADSELRQRLGISGVTPVIINPRGARSYVRNDVFFRAIPLVLREYPEAVFLCNAMRGNSRALGRINKLGIKERVRLLPSVSHERMAEFFRLASVAVSPSLHDGTPNTLLEAMACGVFPVVGDIESIREWIDDGVNGLLCDPTSPESLAKAILRALKDQPLRCDAREINLRLVAERAEYSTVMSEAEEFYHRVMEQAHSPVRV